MDSWRSPNMILTTIYPLPTGQFANSSIEMNNSSSKRQGNERAPFMEFNHLVAWSTAFGFLDVFILLGNVVTLIVLCTNKKLLHMRANFFLINLAVADMMVGTFAIPMYVYHLVAAWFNEKVWSSQSYKIYRVVDVFVGCASIFTLTIIAMERACSVCWPHVHRHVKVKVYYLLLGLTWFLSIMVSCLRLLYEEDLLSLNFFFYFFLVYFALALSIICLSYMVIWFRMKFRFARRDTNKRSSDQEKRLAVMLSTVTIVFVFTWLPFQIINIVTFFCKPCMEMPHETVYFGKLLHYGNSCMNPIIYSFLVPEFRKTLFKLFAKIRE